MVVVIVQSLSHVWLFVAPLTTAHQASLSFTISWSLLKLVPIESVMPCNHLILCHPLLLLPSIFPSMRVFSNELALHIRWPRYWSFSFSISPSNKYSGLISFRTDWFESTVEPHHLCCGPGKPLLPKRPLGQETSGPGKELMPLLLAPEAPSFYWEHDTGHVQISPD